MYIAEWIISAQIDRQPNQMKPWLKKLYKKLDLNGKRKFMNKFWRAWDTDPLIPVNEFKNEYMERLQLGTVVDKVKRWGKNLTLSEKCIIL